MCIRDRSIDEAYEVFLSVLAVHGYSAVEQDNAIKIVPEINGRQSFTSAISARSPDDRYATDIIKPKYTSANALISILRPLLNTQGHIAVYEPTNSIIIADRVANIKRFQGIINELDKTPGERYELVKLNHSSSSEVSKIIDRTFNDNPGGLSQNQFSSYGIDSCLLYTSDAADE